MTDYVSAPQSQEYGPAAILFMPPKSHKRCRAVVEGHLRKASYALYCITLFHADSCKASGVTDEIKQLVDKATEILADIRYKGQYRASD
jgi:hypothetical protein